MSEGVKTDWEGLWRQHDDIFSSQVIKKSDIPPHAKLIIMRNEYYTKNSNRPEFVYCFASGPAEKAITLQLDREDYITLDEAEETQEKIDKLAECMRRGKANGDIMRLPSESIATAQQLMQEAIRLVEDITGEEWDFTAMTY